MNDGCAAGSFGPSGAMRASADSTRFQKNLNLNRQRTIATKAKIAVISPPTTQKPFGLPLNGMPRRLCPKCPRSVLPGRNIAEMGFCTRLRWL